METLVLRDYQRECVNKIIEDISRPNNSLCVVPTGGGKSIIIAEAVRLYGEPTLIIQPTKEILEQNYAKLLQYVDKEDIGIYSASMGEKEIGHYTFATIGSIYKSPEFFKHFKLVFLDEAHNLNPKSLTGMFTKFLKAIGNPKVIGFTATPYRLDTMYVDWGSNDARLVTTIKLINRMKGFFWGRIIYNMSMQDLIDKGYLCTPTYIDASVIEQSEIPLNKSRSEFDLIGFDRMMESKQEKLLRAVEWGQECSRSVLVFCSSVRQATNMQKIVQGSAVVTAKTPAKERDQIIRDFKEHRIKTVFNVGVLTTGFDHPSLDCIILMRPTRSIMLYVQMLGRGVRIAEGKQSCKIIDLTSTVKNMGRVETICVQRDLDTKWQLVSETGSWHGKELYSFSVNKIVDTSKFDYSQSPF
jgi:DNA repair protein RadD